MNADQYFTNLCLAAFVDGEFDEQELALLSKHAENLQLGQDKAQQILNEVAEGRVTQFVKPQSAEARMSAFKAVVRILRADKKLTSQERKMIIKLGMHMEIDDATIDKALSPSGGL